MTQLPISGRPLQLLVVDQDSEVRALFCDILSSQGYDVRLASKPQEALKSIEHQVPDVIFSGIVFQATNGFEFCRQLRAMRETAGIPIVALTGYCINGILDEVAGAGFSQYLLKPVDIETILSILQSLSLPSND